MSPLIPITIVAAFLQMWRLRRKDLKA